MTVSLFKPINDEYSIIAECPALNVLNGRGIPNMQFNLFIGDNKGQKHKNYIYQIGYFMIGGLLGNCGAVNAHTNMNTNQSYPTHLKKEILQQVRLLQEDVATQCGYSFLVATAAGSSPTTEPDLAISGYEIIETFVNKRTSSNCIAGFKNLNKGK